MPALTIFTTACLSTTIRRHVPATLRHTTRIYRRLQRTHARQYKYLQVHTARGHAPLAAKRRRRRDEGCVPIDLATQRIFSRRWQRTSDGVPRHHKRYRRAGTVALAFPISFWFTTHIVSRARKFRCAVYSILCSFPCSQGRVLAYAWTGGVSSQAGTQTEQARQVGGWMENLCFVFGGSGRWGAEGMLPVDVVDVHDVGSVDR